MLGPENYDYNDDNSRNIMLGQEEYDDDEDDESFNDDN
jgi:hypothetical protein